MAANRRKAPAQNKAESDSKGGSGAIAAATPEKRCQAHARVDQERATPRLELAAGVAERGAGHHSKGDGGESSRR